MDDPRLISHHGVTPRLGQGVFVADSARVVGDVHLGDESSIWYGAVIRGDVYHIRIGARVNVQDMSMIHVTTGTHATTVGDDVTIGHRATLHGCTIEPRALIGMGATVMDGAVVGEEAMVAAGALVPPGMNVPARTLAIGAPARNARPLTEAELTRLTESAAHYAALARTYLCAHQGVTQAAP